MYSTKLSPDGLYAGIILMARRPYYFLLHRAKRASTLESCERGRAAAETRKKNSRTLMWRGDSGRVRKKQESKKKLARYEKKIQNRKNCLEKKMY